MTFSNELSKTLIHLDNQVGSCCLQGKSKHHEHISLLAI